MPSRQRTGGGGASERERQRERQGAGTSCVLEYVIESVVTHIALDKLQFLSSWVFKTYSARVDGEVQVCNSGGHLCAMTASRAAYISVPSLSRLYRAAIPVSLAMAYVQPVRFIFLI